MYGIFTNYFTINYPIFDGFKWLLSRFFPQGFNRKSQILDLPQVTFQEWAAKEEAQLAGPRKPEDLMMATRNPPRPRPPPFGHLK